MILMALDHVRDYFHLGSFFRDPLNLSSASPVIFMTRWITHFCAPVFVLLAGISSYLYVGKSDDKKRASLFIFSRRVFLVFLELTVINFAWTFDISFSFQLLQVIWAIGFALMFLAVAVFLPRKLTLVLGLFIIIGHNLLDSISYYDGGIQSLLWYFLHQSQSVSLTADKMISFSYPILPWVGIIFIGYGLGFLFSKDHNSMKRKKILMITGLLSCIVFIFLRAFNIYGDSSYWYKSSNIINSLFLFIKTTKYPPSLLFSLMTLGPAFILLSLYENFKSPVHSVFMVYGRVPLFFYIIHLYLIHLAALITWQIISGRGKELILTAEAFRTGALYDYGYGLPVVYLVWGLLVILLYPLCKIYGSYKEAHRDKLWLKYF